MSSETRQADATARCTMCPAGCGLRVVRSGAGLCRAEPPLTGSSGLCPRGQAIGELLNSPHRIRWAMRKTPTGPRETNPDEAARAIVSAIGDDEVIFFIDATLPCEQILAADAWCRAWPHAKLCAVMEPAERELLLGTEASGAAYLSDADLTGCGGILIIGDALAANPACSRAVFDRRAAEPRMPIVVIDPGGGSASKFATVRVAAPPGGELAAVAAVARGAGADAADVPAPTGLDVSAARMAGAALATSKRIGVILAAEYGRGGQWRQIGFAAGKLAAALGGGVACQTSGANALAALRLGPELSAISLADALARPDAVWVAAGCDVLGLLGIRDRKIIAAAAAFANCSTEAAEFILPAALAAELDGTILLSGERQAHVAAAMLPPAGALRPVDVIATIARAAGVADPEPTSAVAAMRRLAVAAPDMPRDVEATSGEAGLTLLLGRQAAHAGCGELTSHAGFQAATGATPTVRLSAADARALGLKDLDLANVRGAGLCVQARVAVSPTLDAGAAVLPEALPDARAIGPLHASAAADSVVALPRNVNIEAANDYASPTS